MKVGYYISGGLHTAMIGWVLFGGVFRSEPEPAVIAGVDIISSQQFETLLAAQRAPSPEADVDVPVAPEISPEVPEPPAPDQPQPRPEPVDIPEPAEPDPAPVVPEPVAPVEVAPEPEDITPPVEEPEPTAPTESLRPVARPDTRVAPEAVAPPEPDVQVADVDQAPSEPAEVAEPVEEAPAPTAREEAVTEIPTEPTANVTAAPAKSIRPKLRPNRPQPTRPQPTETADSAQPETNSASNDSVLAALAEAQAEEPATPSGPPLTQGERDALRVSVQDCWVVDVGSQSADVTVVVGLSLDRDGKVVNGSLRQLSATGGTDAAARAAFDAARRAILRCQKSGYNLPIEKYDHWRDIEMTFNPENMRRR